MSFSGVLQFCTAFCHEQHSYLCTFWYPIASQLPLLHGQMRHHVGRPSHEAHLLIDHLNHQISNSVKISSEKFTNENKSQETLGLLVLESVLCLSECLVREQKHLAQKGHCKYCSIDLVFCSVN